MRKIGQVVNSAFKGVDLKGILFHRILKHIL